MRLTRLLASAILGAAVLMSSQTASAEVSLSITVAPPPLPVYDQPPIPDPDYIWTPGYWAWDEDESDYYWVPGAWTPAPEPGLLWTPGYWGWDNGVYVFHDGYWGTEVGYYGGVNYGYGYGGIGYGGGYWSGGVFFYNRTVCNFGSVHITNVYSKTVINNNVHVSFNGGPGGLTHHPNAVELKAASVHKVSATDSQKNFFKSAKTQQDSHFKSNNGNPKSAAATSTSNPKFTSSKSTSQSNKLSHVQSRVDRKTLSNGNGKSQNFSGKQNFEKHTSNTNAVNRAHTSSTNTQRNRPMVRQQQPHFTPRPQPRGKPMPKGYH